MFPIITVAAFFAAVLDFSTGRRLARILEKMTILQIISWSMGFAALYVGSEHFCCR